MSDQLIDSIVTATRLSPDRVRDIIERAEDAFWADLVAHAPGNRSGDLDPGAAHAFTEACRNAAAAWLIANVKPTPTTGAITVRVELRAPLAGERGWWVRDDSSPHAALRELLANCPEVPPGFEVIKTDTYDGRTYDEEGMRLVTVIVTTDHRTPQEWLTHVDVNHAARRRYEELMTGRPDILKDYLNSASKGCDWVWMEEGLDAALDDLLADYGNADYETQDRGAYCAAFALVVAALRMIEPEVSPPGWLREEFPGWASVKAPSWTRDLTPEQAWDKLKDLP